MVEPRIQITEVTAPRPSGNGHRKMLPLSQWREYVMAQPPTDDLIHDVLPNSPSDYMIMCGCSGIGKTNLALDMAFCLATGHPWFSFKVKRCRVGYLGFEGAPKKLLVRLEKLEHTYGDAGDNLCFERTMPFKLAGPGVARFEALIEGLQVVFIDPIRYMVQGDYNKPEHASNFIGTVKAACQKMGTVPILLHHVKKPDPRLKVRPEDLQYEVKGPTEYVDAAGTLLLLERARQNRSKGGVFAGNADDRTLYFCKVKDAPADIAPMDLQFNRDTLLYQPKATVDEADLGDF